MKQVLMAALLAGPAILHAQNTGEIHGRVVDETGRPIEFVAVAAEQAGTRFGTETDTDGRFILKPLPAGTYTLRFITAERPTVEMTGVRVDPGLNNRLKPITMPMAELGPVEVVAYRWEEPLIRPDDPSRMVITTAQIKSNAVRKDPVKLVTSMTPGVTRSANGDELYFRGSRSGAMAYFVDGVKMSALTAVPPDAINSVTVYTGGLPARYGDVTGGVVAIETKSYFDLYQQRNAER